MVAGMTKGRWGHMVAGRGPTLSKFPEYPVKITKSLAWGRNCSAKIESEVPCEFHTRSNYLHTLPSPPILTRTTMRSRARIQPGNKHHEDRRISDTACTLMNNNYWA